MEITSNLINTVGLVLDLIGAGLLGYEIFRKYDGEHYEPSAGLALGADNIVKEISEVQPTAEFSKWNLKRLNMMKVGFGFLIFGFLVQIYSNWHDCLF